MILTDGIHLVSTTSTEELHLFARKLGLHRDWFQEKATPHYDLTTDRMHKLAIKMGAQHRTSKQLVKELKRNGTTTSNHFAS